MTDYKISFFNLLKDFPSNASAAMKIPSDLDGLKNGKSMAELKWLPKYYNALLKPHTDYGYGETTQYTKAEDHEEEEEAPFVPLPEDTTAWDPEIQMTFQNMVDCGDATNRVNYGADHLGDLGSDYIKDATSITPLGIRKVDLPMELYDKEKEQQAFGSKRSDLCWLLKNQTGTSYGNFDATPVYAAMLANMKLKDGINTMVVNTLRIENNNE